MPSPRAQTRPARVHRDAGVRRSQQVDTSVLGEFSATAFWTKQLRLAQGVDAADKRRRKNTATRSVVGIVELSQMQEP